jgi:hypothetical protein
MTEHSFHGIDTSRPSEEAKSVTHVSGTFCHPCLDPRINALREVLRTGIFSGVRRGYVTPSDRAFFQGFRHCAGIAYRPPNRVCIPEDQVTNEQLRHLVVKLAATDQNPRRTDGGDLVVACIRAVYPCPAQVKQSGR